MRKSHPRHSGGSDHDREGHSGGDRHREPENDKGNAAHIEIEERRFRGGLTPTPELYALAREQWNRLSGAVSKSPLDPVGGKPPGDSESKPAGARVERDEKEGSQ